MVVLKLEKTHIKPVSHMLVRSFKDDQIEVFPDPEERRIKAPYVHELFLRCAFPYLNCFVTSPKLEGVIAWRHSDMYPGISWWRILNSGTIILALKIGHKALSKIMEFDQYMDSKRKELAPAKHCYLNMLAVDPQYQGKGYASLLLNEMLSQIDNENLPCYLETNGNMNVSIYQRFGYKVIGEYTLDGVSYKMVAMLREPKSI
jgi:hypothetical protein